MKPHHARALATVVATACLATPAVADTREAEMLRAELKATRDAFEQRVGALEARIRELEAGQSAATTTAPAGRVAVERLDALETRVQQVEDSTTAPPAPRASDMNPQMSLVLGGSWNNLEHDPDDYLLQGFIPGGEEAGPGERGFGLGESELTLSANIDPLFHGQATFAVTAEDEIEVEEAFVRSNALPRGIVARAGRFFSAVGHLNTQHAHTWDFVDAPLVYDAMFGGQYRTEGVALSWLAPLDSFLEFGVELGNGHQFPGSDAGNGVGAWTAYVSAGDDIGDSASWKAGVAWLDNEAVARGYEEPDSQVPDAVNPTEFSGDSRTWSVFAVYKWAPEGNARERNFKLQTEYFSRREHGTLEQLNTGLGTGAMAYRGTPSGWYAQAVYQFRPAWRIGARYDRLDSGSARLASLDGVLSAADYPTLAEYEPERVALMVDYSPTEFSRLRLQFTRDQSAPGRTDEQVRLQYLMSLGAHGAHPF